MILLLRGHLIISQNYTLIRRVVAAFGDWFAAETSPRFDTSPSFSKFFISLQSPLHMHWFPMDFTSGILCQTHLGLLGSHNWQQFQLLHLPFCRICCTARWVVLLRFVPWILVVFWWKWHPMVLVNVPRLCNIASEVGFWAYPSSQLPKLFSWWSEFFCFVLSLQLVVEYW